MDGVNKTENFVGAIVWVVVWLDNAKFRLTDYKNGRIIRNTGGGRLEQSASEILSSGSARGVTAQIG
jgi:hypothetical protein